MPIRILTRRELNRATLARQLLLTRASMHVPAAIAQLVGLQAQQPLAPYIGLWTRLDGFQRDDLARLIDERIIVKTTLMRATLHLSTAGDYLRLRATLQPMLTRGFEAILRDRAAGLDVEKVVDAARDYLSEQPRTFAEISAMLTALMPDTDVGAMRYGVRTHLPLVQVPIPERWSYPGNPQFTLAEHWLGKSIPNEDNLKMLLFRYLVAFGPATVQDMQTWSGLEKLKGTIEALRPEWVTYRDERKRELFDLPDMPLPDADTPAPERLLPEYDNLLLSHQDRTRIVADEYRSKVFLPGLRVRSTFLVDGFVRGGWKIERKKKTAALFFEPFDTLTPGNRAALTEEGERLMRFVEADASTFEIHFTQ